MPVKPPAKTTPAPVPPPAPPPAAVAPAPVPPPAAPPVPAVRTPTPPPATRSKVEWGKLDGKPCIKFASEVGFDTAVEVPAVNPTASEQVKAAVSGWYIIAKTMGRSDDAAAIEAFAKQIGVALPYLPHL
jgi:hypothetical protein